MPPFLNKTLETLQDFIISEQRQKAQSQTPQFQNAVLQLQQAKEQAAQQEIFRQRLINASPEELPDLIIRQSALGNPGIAAQGLLNRQNTLIGEELRRRRDVPGLIKDFSNLNQEDITGFVSEGDFPATATPRIPVKGGDKTFSQKLAEIRAESQARAEGTAAGKASTSIERMGAIASDVNKIFGLYDAIPDVFKGPVAGRTIGLAGQFLQQDIKSYEDVRELNLSNILKTFGQEVGVLTDKDVARVSKAQPNIADPPGTAETKKKFLLNYINNRIKAEQKIAGKKVIGLRGLGKGDIDPNFDTEAPQPWETDLDTIQPNTKQGVPVVNPVSGRTPANVPPQSQPAVFQGDQGTANWLQEYNASRGAQ